MTRHEHEFITVRQVPHAEIDERDPVAHTAFIVLGCPTCHHVEAFPATNMDLVTPRFMRALADDLERDGWRFDVTAQIPQLRRDVAAGSGHECDEWRAVDGRCRLCDRTDRR